MKETLQVINQMVADNVIDDYVIGGAIAATYYLEPINTSDVDIFFHIAVAPSELITLSPLYDYLRERGYEPQDDTIVIAEWPVQFLPIFYPLLEEAHQQALSINFHGVPTRIMQAVHLMAIMIQSGRPKDYARLLQFIEAEAVDFTTLEAVLTRHDLREKWMEFLSKFGVGIKKE